MPEAIVRDETREKGKGGRRRRYENPAARARAWRASRQLREKLLDTLIEALTQACERGRSCRLTNHLPEEPEKRVAELVRRLDAAKVVVCRREDQDDNQSPGKDVR